jgi:hypothetical protein
MTTFISMETPAFGDFLRQGLDQTDAQISDAWVEQVRNEDRERANHWVGEAVQHVLSDLLRQYRNSGGTKPSVLDDDTRQDYRVFPLLDGVTIGLSVVGLEVTGTLVTPA